jgi:hypothetical protein
MMRAIASFQGDAKGESFAAKPTSVSRLARRRKTAAPVASRPAMLQTFFPRSMPGTNIHDPASS